MDTVDERALLRLQRFGSRDVGLNHHLFDQAVCFQPLLGDDALDFALVVKDDPSFRQVQVKRATLVARLGKRSVRAPERFEDCLQQLTGFTAGLSINGRLRFLI